MSVLIKRKGVYYPSENLSVIKPDDVHFSFEGFGYGCIPTPPETQMDKYMELGMFIAVNY